MNLPEEFQKRILSDHADGSEFLSAISNNPSLSVRFNPLKSGAEEALADHLSEAVDWCTDGRYLSSRPQFTLMPEMHAGAFYVQEASSMFLSHALKSIADMLPAAPVCLDMCAAPGGKTTLLLSRLSSRGIVVANEYVRNRAWILRENVAKWGHSGVIVTSMSAEQITASGARFDLVLVDAPCSGEGMFRKDETAIREWSPRVTDECASRQREILAAIWDALNEGGVMVYSTCTFNPAENEQMVDWIIETLGAECIQLTLPEAVGITTVRHGSATGYAFYPHKVRGEGLFMSLLRKTSPSTFHCPSTKRQKEIPPKKVTHLPSAGSLLNANCVCYDLGDALYGFPSDRAQTMLQLVRCLNPLMAGIPVGTLTEKKSTTIFTPAPELPLAVDYRADALPVVSVDKPTALKFLHGDTDLRLDDSADGWVVLSYNNLNLGLVKRIGNRVNNYYPKEWRIRRDVGNS